MWKARTPGQGRGCICFRRHSYLQKIVSTCTIPDKVSLFFLFSKLWQLGSWQFVLSKWYLPVPLRCPSLDVVQCRRSQTELSPCGIRKGGKKTEKLPSPDDNTHTQFLQFSEYRDAQTGICKERRTKERRKETIRELQQGHSSDGEQRETLTARVSRRSFAVENKESDEEKGGIKGAKDQTKGDK